MRQVNVNVLQGANTATVTGVQIDSNQLIDVSFHLVVGDASAAGTFLIQASNDVCAVGQANSGNFVVSNWATVSTTAQAAGNQQLIIQLSNISYRWIRAVWTHTTSGTAGVSVNMFAVGA